MNITIPEIDAVFLTLGKFAEGLKLKFNIDGEEIHKTIELLLKLNFLISKAKEPQKNVQDENVLGKKYSNEDIKQTVAMILKQALALGMQLDGYEIFNTENIQRVIFILNKIDDLDSQEKKALQGKA